MKLKNSQHMGTFQNLMKSIEPSYLKELLILVGQNEDLCALSEIVNLFKHRFVWLRSKIYGVEIMPSEIIG